LGLGFVAWFSQNNTFRPQLAVTREQLVSLVLESFQGIQGANLTFPSNLSIRLYSEVDISCWSAGKVLFSRTTQPVTRLKLIGVLPIAAEFGLSAGMQPNLVAKEPSKTFSDIQNYGAASIITQMSSYCSVAAALNEISDAFDNSAKRNYGRLLCGW
jgi:N-acetylmuramoyl-L-alanine amidase